MTAVLRKLTLEPCWGERQQRVGKGLSEEDAPIGITTCGDKDSVSVDVHCQGDPIPPGSFARVFTPFEQASSAEADTAIQGSIGANGAVPGIFAATGQTCLADTHPLLGRIDGGSTGSTSAKRRARSRRAKRGCGAGYGIAWKNESVRALARSAASAT